MSEERNQHMGNLKDSLKPYVYEALNNGLKTGDIYSTVEDICANYGREEKVKLLSRRAEAEYAYGNCSNAIQILSTACITLMSCYEDANTELVNYLYNLQEIKSSPTLEETASRILIFNTILGNLEN
jgi:hypothetical protein